MVPDESPKDYFNRKGWFSLNIQALVDSRYRFMDMCIGCMTRGSSPGVSFHCGADHYDACQYGDSTMAQVQLGAFHYGAGPVRRISVWRSSGVVHSSMAQVQYGAFQYGAGPVWRISVWRSSGVVHSSMAQVQYGAFQYGAGPVRRISVWRSSGVTLRSIVLNVQCRV